MKNFDTIIVVLACFAILLSLFFPFNLFLRKKKLDELGRKIKRYLITEVILSICCVAAFIYLITAITEIPINISRSFQALYNNGYIDIINVRAFFAIPLIIAQIIVWFSCPSLKHLQNEQQKNRRINDAYEQYKLVIIPKIPSKAETVALMSGNETTINGIYCVWCSDSILMFVRHFDNAESFAEERYLMEIPLSMIERYEIDGEHYRETKITGGDVNLAGALVGGMIAGGAGMVLGGRNGISSYQIEHDTRRTVMTIKLPNGDKRKLVFDFHAFEVFKDIVPEKNGEIVSEIEKKQLISQQTQPTALPSSNITDSIRKLKELKDEGLISDEEFAAKREELLSRM